MQTPLDTIKLDKASLIFIDAQGQKLSLPNLTALLNLYHKKQETALGKQIAYLLSGDISQLLIMEVMMDMTHPETLRRIETGEISKTMAHVADYSVILNSHLEEAKELFQLSLQSGLTTGGFEDCHFAQFPFGLVIKTKAFPNFHNTRYDLTELKIALSSH